MSEITRELAEFAATIAYRELPPGVAQRTRALIFDQVGIAFRARQEAAISESASAALERLGLGAGEASVIGDLRGYAPPAAAFFNGALGHCLDFDDTHARGSIHPSAPIVPAALAAAEMCGATGGECIAAITAGYEVQIRLSVALGPSDHYARGYHPTATCGVFGAAAAAGRIYGLSAEQMASAFGLCGSQAAGSMQFLVDGAWNKPFHVGYAAMSGLIAATLAGQGFRGAQAAIEGESGFLHAYASAAEPSRATEGLGEQWETLQIAVKPYPSCRYGHAAMDALIALREDEALNLNDVTDVEIGLPEIGWKLIGAPEADKQNPQNYVDGQFSMPFVAAVALRDGGMSWDSYAQHLADPETLALCRRTRSVVDPEVQAHYPAYMAGSATIQTSAGPRRKVVTVAKGEPENFPCAAELRAKFDGLIGGYLESGQRDALAGALHDFESVEDVSTVLELSRPRAEAPRAASAGD